MTLRRPGERPSGRTAHSCEAPKERKRPTGCPVPRCDLGGSQRKGLATGEEGPRTLARRRR
jgi:hypothetical protein